MKLLTYQQFKLICRAKKVIDITCQLRANCASLFIQGKDIFEGLPIVFGNDNEMESYEVGGNTFASIIQFNEKKIIGIFSNEHKQFGDFAEFSVEEWEGVNF